VKRINLAFGLVLATSLIGACDSGADEDRGDDDGGTVTKGDDIDDTEPPPPPASSCVAACTVEQECLGGSLDGCSATCTTDRDFYSNDRGFACVGNYDALLGCIAALTCSDALIYADGYAETYPCQLEEESFVDACILQGDPAPAACVAICEKVATCAISDVSDCEASCAQQISFATALADECGTAQTDLLICAEALECGDLSLYYQGDETVCADETTLAATVCAM
jgi:hypothetical protein